MEGLRDEEGKKRSLELTGERISQAISYDMKEGEGREGRREARWERQRMDSAEGRKGEVWKLRKRAEGITKETDRQGEEAVKAYNP